ncbi:MAG: phage holin family protein [Rhodoferax sp.]|nr:phage holin family protein [Rhodoferax sp.]
MSHPLLHLIATRPQLLLEHLEAYVELAGAEAGEAASNLKRGALFGALGLGCLVIGVSLGGVALLLCAVVPLNQMPAPWALWAVPLPPIVLAIGCLLAARKPHGSAAFEHLRHQIKSDVAMFRQDAA